MTQYSRPWEKRLRRQIRVEVRATPDLWQEYKRRRQERRKASLLPKLWSILFWLVLAVSILIQVFASTESIPLLSLVLVSTTSLCWRANGLRYALRDPDLHRLLAHFPITKLVAFRHLWWKWMLGGLWFILPLCVCLAAVETTDNLRMSSWSTAFLFICVQWIVLHAAAVCLAHATRLRPLWQTGFVLLLLAGMAFFHPSWFVVVEPVIAAGAQSLLPAGWVTAAFRGHWLWLLPASIVVAFSVFSWKQLRAQFIAEPDLDVEPLPQDWEDGILQETTQPVTTPGMQLDDRLRCRAAFDAPTDHPPLWLDGIVWRWLTPREQGILLASMGDAPMNLVKRWRNAAIFTGAGMLIALFLPSSTASWIIPVAILISLGTLASTGGMYPVALYPVGFWEMVCVKLKTALLPLALWVPMPLLGGVFLAMKWDSSPITGLAYGCKVAMLALAIVPLSIVMGITSATNDSSSRRCATRFGLAALLSILMTLAGGMTFLFAPMPFPLAGLAVVCLFQWWFLWRYGSWFNQMRFDLMPRIR